MPKTIISKKVSWDENTNKCFLETYYKNHKGVFSIEIQPITPEEAAKLSSELNGY